MPHPRLPVAKAAATGAAIKNPGRHKDRKGPKKVVPLGDPSPHLKDGGVIAWEGFKRELPWLTEGHRALVEVASNLRGRMIDNEEVGVNALSLLQVCLSKLGATPTDETKLSLADDGDEADPIFDA
jgi:hypothetical protein